MKVGIYRDEMYPVYYISLAKNFPNQEPVFFGEKVVEWPAELNMADYDQTMIKFREWQEKFEKLFEWGELVPTQKETGWSTTNSPSAIPTSSTPTS